MIARQSLAHDLLEQVRTIGELTDRCRGDKLTEFRYNMHTVVLAYGVGRFCSRNRCAGIRRGRLKECFKNAAHLVINNRERYVYCEGYAVRPSLEFVVGLHAWVLDRERGWEIVDPTWRDTSGSAYLGVPFNPAYLRDQLIANGVYGLIDVWPARHPVLRSAPETYLHQDAALIPRDFHA